MAAIAMGWLLGTPLGCSSPTVSEPYEAARLRMVQEQIAARGVEDQRVLDAMRRVPRHQFVPEQYRAHAYEDHPLPIPEGQTISQPYVVAAMTEQLRLEGKERVLEVGTGSGYQAAILAELAEEVYTIEIVRPLAETARARLADLGYRNVTVRWGNGYLGWPAHAPFDSIIVTAAPERVPPALVEQLAVGGRMVIPVGGEDHQELLLVTRDEEGVRESSLMGVRFVPMTGSPEPPP
jgi:protein-L-isoaspartate(D-aspartate) O-methyltransferase